MDKYRIELYDYAWEYLHSGPNYNTLSGALLFCDRINAGFRHKEGQQFLKNARILTLDDNIICYYLYENSEVKFTKYYFEHGTSD